MKLIVGLGNPGSTYAGTRHNAGFMVINSLAKKIAVSLDTQRCQSRLGEGTMAGEKIVLARPGTYMNLSGEAVACLVNRYRVSSSVIECSTAVSAVNKNEITGQRPVLLSSDLLVIVDDTNLDLGRIRLRLRGSSGGHRGLASIIEHLGGSDFPRLRVGVGMCPPHLDMAEYVLSEFAPEEVEIIQESIDRAASAVITFITEGIEKAMDMYNGYSAF
ncbi:MAG: aminoacyl-tRNA hydrolase [bacterium]|nr:aminoacyl-tRNA hydrolase [bacterium]